MDYTDILYSAGPVFLIALYQITLIYHYMGSQSGYISYNENTISWYAESAGIQFNATKNYNWLVMG